ncbi:hypothetical protein LPJ63_002538, partial [Coemansia sp. RSA 2711]
MKRQLGLFVLVAGTAVAANAESKGLGLFEVDMNYDPAEYFPKPDRFDQPDAFSRDINNF